ncbi:MAG: GspE/PulE family protein [Ramlibacter sp.]|nr:GspE/PulE family protein [Ramlibacter sp.]
MDELRTMTPQWQAVSYSEAGARKVLILRDGRNVHWLVMVDFADAATETWGRRRCARLRVALPELAAVGEEDLLALLAQHEHGLRAMDVVEPGSAAGDVEEVAAVITLAALENETSAVVRLVNSTLYDGLKLNASDIHLECDPQGLRILYRLDGVLVPITEMPGLEMADQVISRIKVMAELDIAERRVPQDGRFKVRVGEREVDFRVSVMPSVFGEDAVLRLLDRKALAEEGQGLTLDKLGLSHDLVKAARRLAHKPHGMLLVTGPTGSGKTTTLYATICEIHTGRDKIVTIEDPVEYRLPRVLQIPVNEKKGLTFARGLRSILRHDPDKIMVGEIRDNETAQIAVQAALTGHLVLTTVHANNVLDVLGRFLHMGVDGYSLASALNGILAQRLLRINCDHCTQAATPDQDLLEDLGLASSRTRGWNFLEGKGCGHCRGTGYKGRRAVAEVLVLDDELRELIAQRAPASVIKQAATRAGWMSLTDCALGCAARGETTLAEVARVAG